jgi:hypothetical protein
MPILNWMMRRSRSWLFAATLLLVAEIHAEQRTVLASIADIVSKFEHKCTAAQCETLRTIAEADTVTVAERTLAAALLRVDHVPDAKDISLLDTLASNPAQPSDVRAIATMLRRLVHMPTEADRAVLDAFVSGAPDDR